jgi:hypothetical protein
VLTLLAPGDTHQTAAGTREGLERDVEVDEPVGGDVLGDERQPVDRGAEVLLHRPAERREAYLQPGGQRVHPLDQGAEPLEESLQPLLLGIARLVVGVRLGRGGHGAILSERRRPGIFEVARPSRLGRMPSFRVQLEIGGLLPGVAPETVLPAAADAAAELAEVEASDLAIVRGAPRAIVRFAIEEPQLAEQVASHVAARTAALAEVRRWSITRREHGRWVPAGDR